MSTLHGWRAIADHLGVKLETARGYKRRGIPVIAKRRVPAVAETDALDAWMRQQRASARSPRFGRDTHESAPLDFDDALLLDDEADEGEYGGLPQEVDFEFYLGEW